MSMGMKILLGMGVLFAVVGLSLAGTMISVKNTCVANEKGIEAQYEQNQSNLAGYTNKIMDMVQVPDMAKNAVKELTTAAIQGRYGENGSQAVFQMIHENNPTMDPSLYKQLMQAMESGRNAFDVDQKTLIDKCRVYDTYTEQFPQSIFVAFFGYPRYDRTKCKPVITDSVAHDFSTKRTGPLQLTK